MWWAGVQGQSARHGPMILSLVIFCTATGATTARCSATCSLEGPHDCQAAACKQPAQSDLQQPQQQRPLESECQRLHAGEGYGEVQSACCMHAQRVHNRAVLMWCGECMSADCPMGQQPLVITLAAVVSNMVMGMPAVNVQSAVARQRHSHHHVPCPSRYAHVMNKWGASSSNSPSLRSPSPRWLTPRTCRS
jgi:hypothetical protein